MATQTATQTNIGLLQKLRLAYGQTSQACIYIGLDGADTAESESATSPSQELSTNGCGRVQGTVSDVSSGGTIALRLQADYVFTGDNTIKAVFGAWSSSPGANMAWRAVLGTAYAVGQNDQLTVKVTDTISRGT